MVRNPRLFLALTGCATLALTSCSSGVGNASPRVQAIPAQSSTGGAFSLDLSSYVSDREGTALTYRVVDGGGSFSGSTYTNTFDTVGTYSVTFEVHDNEKITRSDFEVMVTAASLAVVKDGTNGLNMLDTGTGKFVTLAVGATSPQLAATLSDGKVLYNLGQSSVQTLWVFDPMTRQTQQLGTGHAGAATYVTKTSDDLVLFTCGTSPDLDLYSFDATSGQVRAVSANAGENDGDPMVNKDNLVFFERGNGGQADIYYYDPSANESVAVSTNAAGEDLHAVLADGGVVFSRVENGLNQLYYFRVDVGLTTVAQPASAVDAAKTYVGKSGSSDVVFRFRDNNVPGDALGWWNVNGTSGSFRASTATATLTLAGTTAKREFVFVDEVSSTDHDLYVVDTAGTTLFGLNTADLVSVKGISSDGTNSYVTYQDTTTTNLHIRNVTAGSTATESDAAGLAFLAVLDNGDVVFQKADQTSISLRDVSASATNTAPGTGMTYAGPGPDAGDVVFTTEVAAQTDLFLWDSSATSAVLVSNNAADDTFEALAEDGKVLFTRIDGSNVQQLQAFDPAGSTTTTLTSGTTDQSVLGVFEIN